MRKKRRSRRKKEGKEKDLKRDGENPDSKDDTKSIIFARPLSLSLSIL